MGVRRNFINLNIYSQNHEVVAPYWCFPFIIDAVNVFYSSINSKFVENCIFIYSGTTNNFIIVPIQLIRETSKSIDDVAIKVVWVIFGVL